MNFCNMLNCHYQGCYGTDVGTERYLIEHHLNLNFENKLLSVKKPKKQTPP